MTDNFETNEMPNRNDCSESYNGYLKRAADACEAGDLVLGMHLYLAAYEKAVIDPNIPDGMALSGLREAWHLACDLKERSLAEYVFEKLEPYLTGSEIAACAHQLQTLALDRLEQYGFSRDDLQEMAEMIAQDFVGDGSVLKVESISIPGVGVLGMAAPQADESHGTEVNEGATEAQAQPDSEPKASDIPAQPSEGEASHAHIPEEIVRPKGKPGHAALSSAPVDDFNPYDEFRNYYSVGKSYHCATNEGSGAHVFTRDEDRAKAGELAKKQAEEAAKTQEQAVPEKSPEEPSQQAQNEAATIAKMIASRIAQSENAASQTASAGNATQAASTQSADAIAEDEGYRLNYRNLVGYDEAISVMRSFGIGLQHDKGFTSFLGMLNERHGLDRAPALDTLLIRAPVIEDAGRFIDATIGEIGLPALRMSMEEGMQGVPLLCVTTQGNSRPRMNHANNRFEAPAILVIDDLDSWIMPSMPENVEGMSGFVMANISRGAREAVNMIRSAVEDPDVLVLATATLTGEPDPFFLDMLEPLTIVDIGYPTDQERMEIWSEIARNHPSMRQINRVNLMRYSEGLPRYDIYIAAREAIEDAYKQGLVHRGYVPVTPYNIFEKLAACQPVDSDQYRALEDEVIRSFQSEMDDLEDLINGARE
ncbi:MAG: ribonucleotide reductase subunit alpha [Eggerthellaceae bacterium]|nr:ribonucleotide reductase subunit alpha [Eggerthellaceae bacterium]